MQIKVVNLEGDASAQEATLNAFTKDFWDIVSIVHDGYAKGKVTAYLRKNQIDSAPAIARPAPLNTREAAPTGPHGDTKVRSKHEKGRG